MRCITAAILSHLLTCRFFLTDQTVAVLVELAELLGVAFEFAPRQVAIAVAIHIAEPTRHGSGRLHVAVLVLPTRLGPSAGGPAGRASPPVAPQWALRCGPVRRPGSGRVSCKNSTTSRRSRRVSCVLPSWSSIRNSGLPSTTAPIAICVCCMSPLSFSVSISPCAAESVPAVSRVG